MCEQETFWTLLTNAAHWEFELFLMLLFDGALAGILWPLIRRWWVRHHDHDVCDPKPSQIEEDSHD